MTYINLYFKVFFFEVIIRAAGREVKNIRSVLRLYKSRKEKVQERAMQKEWGRGMVRRLDKIEKEMGYCEIKLEKERRIRKQILFLQNDLEALDRLISEYKRRGFQEEPETNLLGVDARHQKNARERFLAAGLQEILQEERDILNRESEGLQERLQNFSGFETKRSFLEEEKRKALKNLAPAHSSKLRKINESLKKIEKLWNSLVEDLNNFDEGIFFIERNLDYLRSCRSFLISAKGNFDIESWLISGYLPDLFRHSNIGRAKEMADGADRNLKMAQKELVCISSTKIRCEHLQRALVPFLEAVFEDIFLEGRLEESLRILQSILANNEKVLEQVKAKRSQLQEKLEETEKQRNQVFSQMGPDRLKRLVC